MRGLARDGDPQGQGGQLGDEPRQRRAPTKQTRAARAEREAAVEGKGEGQGPREHEREAAEQPQRAGDWSMDEGLSSALGLGEADGESSLEGSKAPASQEREGDFRGRSHSSYRTRNSIQAPRCVARRSRRAARTMTCHVRSNSKEATARSSWHSGRMTLSKRNRKSRRLNRTVRQPHEASKARWSRRVHLALTGRRRIPESLRRRLMLRWGEGTVRQRQVESSRRMER